MQMELLLQNLISNALKFSGNESPQIQINAKNWGNEWVFSIKDNGIGIDPKFNERIFVIFQRLHEWEQYPGTGLGLALCKKIVEGHRGRIWIDSEKGKGVFFTFPFLSIQLLLENLNRLIKAIYVLQRQRRSNNCSSIE